MLIIGLGGGIIPMALLERCPPGTRMESIEYDPQVLEVAKDLLGFHPAASTNMVEINDGGMAVHKRAEQKVQYDVVMVDAFSGDGVPESCRSAEFITDVQSILKPGGLAFHNVNVSPQYEEIFKNYKQTFGQDNVKGEVFGRSVKGLKKWHILARRDAPTEAAA